MSSSVLWSNKICLTVVKTARFPWVTYCRLLHAKRTAGLPPIREKPSYNDITKLDMQKFFPDVRKVLSTRIPLLQEMCHYYFDSTGKSIRPKIVFLASKACNITSAGNKDFNFVGDNQRKVAMISEMIHTGSLIHDDVVDVSSIRRGRDTVSKRWGDRNAVMAGNYVLSRASHLLASISDTRVVVLISRIIDDLVRGEFMQIDSNNNFENYLEKTYKKTASLMANSCKAVAHLSGSSKSVVDGMYEYGRNVGIAFQLADDLLDFTQSADALGKPVAADLRLGLATAPVLFACDRHPFLHDLMLRRFKKPGDVEKALEAVKDSDGLEGTHILAQQYCNDAKKHLTCLEPSRERDCLESIADAVLNRTK